ncbi:MAG: hypothetical protein ACREQ5_32835, partial [Candidatus Dormibacteria bacterium]
SDCWRLRVLHKQSGEYPPGTRVLQLTEDAETAAKTSVPMSLEGVFPTVPQYFVSPTLPKVRAGVGADPTWLFLYGSPGSGKTTFSCSDVIQEKK